ncbi:PAS domain-containing protein [Trichocoleus sp. DQ-U1]|uniref:PAS domain-containing protein n=1 Tax=Trichocoleus sp. DQ-U1 TaxID=2933926 RepID=UPI0032993071
MPEYLEAIQECCRDEAAFEKLKQILADGEIKTIQKTTDKLRQQESKFQRMVANIPGMIYQYLRCPDGRESIVCASSGYQELFELEPENIQANFQLLKDLIHPDDVKGYEESVDISAATLQPWAWEGRIVTPTGKIKWVQCASRPEKQANGDILWDGLLMEVTERKRAEAALERERRLFIRGPVTVFRWVAQENRPVEYVSPNISQWGYQPDDFMSGRVTYGSVIHPDDLAQVEAQTQAYDAAGLNFQEQDYRLIRSDGEVRWVYEFTSVVRNDQGNITHYEGYILDITKRKEAEVQLRAAGERDRASICALSAARLLGEIALRIRRSLDLDQILNNTVQEVRQFLQADRVFIAHLDANSQGKVVAESVAPDCRSILGWVTSDRYLRELKSFFKQGQVQAIDDTEKVVKSRFHTAYYAQYQIKASLCVPILVGNEFFGMLIANQCSGSRHWQQFEIELLCSLATQVAIAIQQAQLYEQVSTLNTCLERTVEERTAQLQQVVAELQEMNQLKDVVLHTVSHELRTSVIGTVMVLKNLLNQPAEKITLSRSIVERMIQGNERQLGMINSLLETHSSEEEGIILHCEPIQIKTLFAKILQGLEPTLSQNQATLTNLVSADLPLVMVDPAQLQRVLENLFNHILKHNPPKLSLHLSTTVESQRLRCTVQDNGIGMSQQECDRLFDLYIRDPRSSCSTGTGLKLYLCKQIITAHGGEIGANSSPGLGTTLWFTLPLNRVAS